MRSGDPPAVGELSGGLLDSHEATMTGFKPLIESRSVLKEMHVLDGCLTNRDACYSSALRKRLLEIALGENKSSDGNNGPNQFSHAASQYGFRSAFHPRPFKILG